MPADLSEIRKSVFNVVVKSGKSKRFEDQQQGVWVDNVLQPITDSSGKVIKVAIYSRDITRQKEAEGKLKWELRLSEIRADISRELLSQTYDIKTISDITLNYARELTSSKHGFISSIDKNTLDNVGHTLTDMFGNHCRVQDLKIAFPIGPDGKYPALWGHALNTQEAFFTNKPDTHQSCKGLPEGHVSLNNYLAVPVHIGDRLAGMIALANSERDYSESDIEAIRRMAEIFSLALHRYHYELDRTTMAEQIQKMQKTEAIGTLAGGIAHDFNNILYPLVGFAEMLKDDVPENSPLQEHIDEILHAAFRSRDLVQQILSFSRQGDQDMKPIKLQHVAKEALKLLRASIPTTIDIQQDLDPSCGFVIADPTKFHQIVMNLVTNAYHAMEETGGSLRITLRQVQIDSVPSGFPETLPGEYVCLTVVDTGTGIQKDILDKIFDPYFTTKEQGRGTGLGLSVVHGIVKNLKGDIIINSEPDIGTKVKVFLPVMDRKVDEESPGEAIPITGGTERILLVDDEEANVRMMQQMLKRLGYKVTIQTESIEALEVFKDNPDSFDLIVTDMTMPKMTGAQLAGEIKKIKPDIPIIICTGFSNQISEEKSKALGIDGFVIKPVIKRDIAEAIRKVLSGVKKPT